MENLTHHPELSSSVVATISEQEKNRKAVDLDGKEKISVCIVCRNEADKLGPCLESVSWADEIIVMDLSSSDNSAALAKEHGARIISRAPVPIVELVRNEVAAVAVGEWILALDPDERVTPGLARALVQLRQRADLDAIAIPIMNFDLGYPASNPLHRYDPKPRMYRRSRVQWPVIPNALPKIDESRLYRLPQCDDAVIIHDRNRNIPEILDRVIRYAPAEAQSMIDRGQVFTARDMLVALSRKIYKQFFVGKAFRDGVPGALRASILVAFHFYVWASFWQLSGGRRTAADDRLLQRIGAVIEIPRQLLRICGALYKLAMRLLCRGLPKTLVT